jgi:BlaI family transcriptional regulator, penicillinase repressor
MPARSPLRLLTPQELELMKIIWAAPQVTVRDVYETMRQRRKIAYTTVMTLMRILEKKGHLKRSTAERQHIYRAVRPRSQTLAALLKDFVDRVLSGSAKPLLVHLVADRRLSKSDLEELRRLLKERA